MIEQATKFKKDLAAKVAAGVQAFLIDTPELKRAERLIVEVASEFPGVVQTVYTWDILNGFEKICGPADNTQKPKAGNGVDLCYALCNKALLPRVPSNKVPGQSVNRGAVLVIVKNIHLALTPQDGPKVCQLLQDLVSSERFNSTAEDGSVAMCVPVFLSNSGPLPQALKDLMIEIDLPLPSLDHIRYEYEYVAGTISGYQQDQDTVRDKACRLLLGLPGTQITLALSEAAVKLETRFATDALLDELELAKVEMLKQCSALQYVPKSAIRDLGDVGGFRQYREWIQRRRVCYTEAAEQIKIDKPKGVIMLGLPGTGKTRVAKLTSLLFELPLLILDLSSLFGGVVGTTEAATKMTFKILDAVGPCVVLLDELEKVLAGMGSDSASTDSGVAKRLLSRLLSWLSDNKSGAFVIGTMNRTKGVDAEFMRKGRFDEIFTVGLPTPDERLEICKIHLEKRGIPAELVFRNDQDVAKFYAASGGNGQKHTGAEIETAVVEARLTALNGGSQTGCPTIDELAHALETMRTLADDKQIMEEFKEMEKNFTSATAPKLKSPPRNRRVGNAQTEA